MMDELLADRELQRLVAAALPEHDAAEAAARVAWSVLTEPGDRVAGALIAQLGAAEALRFGLSEQSHGLAERAIQEGRARWWPRAKLKAVRDTLLGAAEVRARLLVPGMPEWPDALDDLGDHAPLLLWVRGDAGALSSKSRVSIVGARAATAYGDQVARELAGDLASSGSIVVSGGAYGIDGAAHRAAMGSGGRTAAFLAGGVDRPYPAGHQQLFEHIRAAGAVASELPCGAAPTRWRFLARNRLISALGDATVVVEAGWRSGSLNTAGHAASLGRPLGAVPGPVTSAASAGCHRLMREYDAVCVTNAEEVRELMGLEGDQSSGDATVTDASRVRLLDAMSTRTARSAAELGAASGLPESQVRSLLGLLALDGIAHQSGGGWRRRAG